ncbi:energy-coupling factor ABC transporter ATP-binding protein [Sporosarcina sp. A2]|uniref:energy-coupling factor ABC transporter ATP-binding protein n=1 Tax=Sporosarcina sp. A2 TaxID=3393449 RepID=UPI003D79C753
MDISFQQVSFAYAPNTPFEKKALHKINATIPTGSYTAVIGHTGSGKSTLLLHLNGLLKPTEGTVRVGDTLITSETKGKALRNVRRNVGIVFQFPEHQLFEETVEKDIMFGPLNFGIPEQEARKRAHELIEMLGLPADVANKSPFELSGGQMRRVAIAGVLAFKPSVLILDEPTAGLDPQGRREIMELFERFHREEGLTTILVTHSMEDAARYAEHVIVMHEGHAVLAGPPEEVLTDEHQLESYRLELPRSVRFQRDFERLVNQKLPKSALAEEELAEMIAALAREIGEPQ